MKDKQNKFTIFLILIISSIIIVGVTHQKTVRTSTEIPSDDSVPKIILIYPSTEDYKNDFKRGNTINIQWNLLNKPDFTTNFPIDIHLLNEDDESIIKIASRIKDTKSYNWLIPTTLTAGKYKIEIDSSPMKQGYGIYKQSGYFSLK